MSEHMSVREDTGPYCNGRYFTGVTAMRCSIGELYLACMKFKLGNGMFCHWSSIFPKNAEKLSLPITNGF